MRAGKLNLKNLLSSILILSLLAPNCLWAKSTFPPFEETELAIKARQIISETLVTREHDFRGYYDRLQGQATMRARTGSLYAEAEDLLYASGAEFEAGKNVSLISGGQHYLGSQQLASETTLYSKRSAYHLETHTHHKSR